MHLEDVGIDGEEETDREGFSDALRCARTRVEDHDLSHVLDPEGKEVGELSHVRGTDPARLTQSTLHGVVTLLIVDKDLE